VLSILGFLAVLGPLVIVHEFGHYLFARIFGVKAEVFSIGFGPIIWKKQLGETELRLSAVPLGGFVKLLGEDGETELPPELQKRALQKQVPWKRFLIFFGGPCFNFIFAILVFMAILLIGEPQLSSVVGRVVRGSAAEQAGLRSGDRITAVNGKPVIRYEEVMSAVSENPNRPVTFDIARPVDAQSEAKLAVQVKPTPQEGYSIYGEATHVGEVNGMIPTARSTNVGISDPQSPAAQAGIVTGDRVLEIDGMPVNNWETLEKIYDRMAGGSQFRVKIENAKKESREVTLTKPKQSRRLGNDLGLRSSELFIEKTMPDSPAAKAGLQPGDRLIGIGPVTVESFVDLRDAVQRAGEKDNKVPVRWEREGRLMTADIVPTATATRDPALKKTTQFTIGVVPMLVWAEPVTFVERTFNPFTLLYKATERMVVFSYRNIVSLGKMFTGDVSITTLGGPILIGKIAGESIARGLISFLTTMAILSVGLGVLNILPIPVLDGGHLLLLAIESVRGRPLTIRQMEIIQQVGLSLIVLLMVVVFKNDLSRLTFFD
jgi:regulator of sigma E protease